MSNEEKQRFTSDFSLEDVLGSLYEPYMEFQKILFSTLEEPTVFMPYRNEVAADKAQDALKKLSTNSTGETFETTIQKAKGKYVSNRDIAIGKAGIVGTIKDVFNKVYEAIGDDDATAIHQLKDQIELHQALPAERLLGAHVLHASGYYWAGFFTPFEEQAE